MKRLLAPVLFLILVLVLTGSYKKRGYKDVPYNRNVAYGPGGVGVVNDSPLDTVTIVFTPNDTLTFNQGDPPGSGDPAAYTAYNAAIAGADFVYELGTDVDFAWGHVDEASPLSWYGLPDHDWRWNTGPNDTWDTELSGSTADRRLPLLYVAIEDVIPAGVKVLSATLNLVPRINIPAANSDSVVVTLMTNPSDNIWYQYFGADTFDMASFANWTYQRGTSPTTGTNAWSPTLNDRKTWMDWGSVSDMSPGTSNGTSVEDNSYWPVRLINCAQAIADGETNNGFVLHGQENNAVVTTYGMYNWESAESRTPWIELTYVTYSREHFPRYHNKEWAFVFTADDGAIAAVDTFRNCIANHPGAMMTIFLSNKQRGGAGYWNWENAAIWDADQFVEVGYHSKNHNATNGLAFWGATGTMQSGLGSAAWDSLMMDTNPAYFYNNMLAYDGIDRTNKKYFNKSFGFPTHNYDGAALQALSYWGYNGWRTGTAFIRTLADGTREFSMPPFVAGADSALAGEGMMDAPLKPRNMDLVPLTVNMANLVGDATTAVDTAVVRTELRRHIRSAIAQDINVVAIYTHDLKFGASGALGNYSNGLEGPELRQMLATVQRNNGAIMSITDYVEARKRGAAPVKTPESWGQLAANDWTEAEARFLIPGLPSSNTTPVDREGPQAATDLVATMGTGSATLAWSDQSDRFWLRATNPYEVHRATVSGGPYTVIGYSATSDYTDASIQPSTDYYYVVYAYDTSNNRSGVSNEAVASPYVPLPAQTFPMYANFNQKERNTDFSDAELDSIATLDLHVVMSDLFDEYRAEYNDWAGYTDKIRSRNPDAIILNYVFAWGVNDNWASYHVKHTNRKLYEFINNNNYWMRDANGDRVPYFDQTWPLYLFNIAIPGMAEEFGEFLADLANASDNMADYTGYMLDYFDWDYFANWPCTGGCQSVVDIDGDGKAYDFDAAETAEELALYRAAQLVLFDTIKQNVNSDKFLLAVNGTSWYNATPAAYMDGGMFEGISTLDPDTEAEWRDVFSMATDMSTAILPSPFRLFDYDARFTADDPYDPIVAASLVGLGYATMSDGIAANRRPWYPDRHPLGKLSLGKYLGGSWPAESDICYRQFEKGYFKGDYTEADGYPYEYVLVDTVTSQIPDTLIISDNWPRAVPPAAVVPPQNLEATADSTNIVIQWDASPNAVDYDIYAGTSASPPYLTTTTTLYYNHNSLPEDTEHFYEVIAVDGDDNESVAATISASTYTPDVVITQFIVVTPTSADTTGLGTIAPEVIEAHSRGRWSRVLFKTFGGAYNDTVWGGAALTPNNYIDESVDSGIDVPTWWPDAGKIQITWTPGADGDRHEVQVSADEGKVWEVLETNATSPYVWETTNKVVPTRTKYTFRVYNVLGTTYYGPLEIGPFYNQCVDLIGKAQVDLDAAAPIDVESSEVTVRYTASGP